MPNIFHGSNVSSLNGVSISQQRLEKFHSIEKLFDSTTSTQLESNMSYSGMIL